MLRKSLVLKIFDGAYMQRWNDKLRPMDLIELDKQAHKMIVAYFLGQFSQENPDFDWMELIEGGIFDLCQRLVITDIKPPVFYKIREDREKYRRLNEFVIREMETYLTPLGDDFFDRFKNYLFRKENNSTHRVLEAAHNYASRWEFSLIENLNPQGFEIEEIKENFRERLEKFADLPGMIALEENKSFRSFIDLCGHLRFQARWSHLHRVPKTSVLGHSLFVAILAYLLTMEIGGCVQRRYNNFFTGLFHDLPEVLTRDIISPIKKSIEGLDDLIKEIEVEQMEKDVYPLLPEELVPELKMFTQDEFSNLVTVEGKQKKVNTAQEISQFFNEDSFKPRDGELLRAIDRLAAFIEARVALENGGVSAEFQEAAISIKKSYSNQKIAGINFGEIFADF